MSWSVLEAGAVLAIGFFAVGVKARQWPAVLAPALLWALYVTAAVLDGGVGDSENSAASVVLLWAMLLLAPSVTATALGVIVGKFLGRARGRRRPA
jgi:hypothetical protein